jgi:hypothetical protein
VPTVTPTPVAAACPSAPLSGCRPPAISQKATVSLRDRSPDAGDRLTWGWNKGSATSKADFGDPLTTTSYRLCLYDGSSHRLSTIHVPAGGTCGTRPCWKETTSGFSYIDHDLTPDGLGKLVLKSGAAARAKITARGKGDNLPMPTLSLTLPVTVQLVNDDGTCWEATYSTARRNDATQFKAKAD